MGLQEQGFIMNGVRVIFGFLDRLIYSLIKWILFGIFDLANLTTNSEVFSGIYSRIYVILGIFMAFKLAFSFFKYIIDPESMSGKSDTRIGKLFSRVFIMLATLIFLPTLLFGQNGQEGLLSRAQRAFLPTLPKVIFGVSDIGGLTVGGNGSQQMFTASIEQSANDIAITTLSGFFAPSEELDSVCGDGTYANTPPIKSLDEFTENINLTCNRKGTIVIDIGIAHTGAKYYKYSYMWFISTVVGVLIAALLLGVTLSIAKRIFKLLILEVMAPIPIMSLIDPKSGKDGAFSKWVKSLISTFADIFLKLGLVYLIIVFIHLIVRAQENGGIFNNFPQNAGFRGTYLTILLILGLIFFAKEAPKFIKESLGFKGDGMGLFEDVKAVGKAAGLVAGSAVATAGTIGAFATNWRAASEENKEIHPDQKGLNFLRNTGSAIAGAIGGNIVANKALMSKNGGPKAVMDALMKRNERRAGHSTLPGRIASSTYGVFTGHGLSEQGNKITKLQEEAVKSIKAYNDVVEEEALDNNDLTGSYNNMNFNYRRLEGLVKAARDRGDTTFDYSDSNGNSYTGLSVDEFSNENVFKEIKKEQAEMYSDMLVNNAVVKTVNGVDIHAQDEWGKAYNKLKAAEKAFKQANEQSKIDSPYDGRNSTYKKGKKVMGELNTKITNASTDMRQIKRMKNDRSTGK